MRIVFTLVAGLVLTSSAYASVIAFLKRDPIVILVQGADSDAKLLFDHLNVGPTDMSESILEKKVESPSGQVVISCRHAKLNETSSCTVRVRRDSNLDVSEEEQRAYLVSYIAEDTEFLFNNFVKDPNGKVPMYVSEKQTFAFTSSLDRFILSYQLVGP